MDARRRSRLALTAAVLVIGVAFTGGVSPATSGRNGINMARAEAIARNAVLVHRSYRQITSTRTGLVTRGCWRAPAAGVRCSLFVVAPTPCALESDPGEACAQALWERRWLVEVRRGLRGLAARILKISSGPAV